MHKYYFRSTNANVESECQYFSHTKWLQILNVKRHGIKITRKNVLSTICNPNLKHLTRNQLINIIGPKKMSNFHQIHLQHIYVRRLCQIFVLTLLQMYLKKLVALFVEN